MASNATMKRWIEYGKQHLEGLTVKHVRYLTKAEMNALGWDRRAIVLIFNDGTFIFPSQDDEGNGPGALFGQDPKNEALTFPVIH